MRTQLGGAPALGLGSVHRPSAAKERVLGNGRSLRLSRTHRGGKSWATLVVSAVALLFTLPAGADVTVPPHTLSIDDVTMNEGNSGTTSFVFTVTLSNPPPGNFTIMVNYATVNGTATAGTCAGGADYVGTSGQLTFNRNNLTRPISVSVCGETVFETDENFFVDLSNPTNEHDEAITKSRGIGTIRNDDAAPQRTTSTNVNCAPSTVPVLGSTTCTATVTDTDTGTSTPQGTVTFSLVTDDGETGAFTPAATCTLDPTASGDTNSCSVSYTPATVGDGTHEIGASYTPTDGVHTASSDPTPFQLTVRARTTSTNVSCTPNTFRAGESTECTATVSDTDSGPAMTPTGTVTWTSSESTGVFTTSPCVLQSTNPLDSSAPSSCTVTYTSTKASQQTITANYSGDLTHKESSGDTTVTVNPGPPASVALSPLTATNQLPEDTGHCVTATVKDTFGNATPGVTVRFSVTGANPATGSAQTGANGEATFCYTGVLVGADIIKAFADTDGDGNQEPGEPSETAPATKTWLAPPSTPLCEVDFTTLGIQIIARNGDHGTGGGNVHVSDTGVASGQQEYQDHGPAEPMNVHSTQILAVVCVATSGGKQATIYFEGTVDGAGPRAGRIEVEDNGEPGTTDKYWIIVSKLTSIYDSGKQQLTGGNVQVH
jgi:hypothetical protein